MKNRLDIVGLSTDSKPLADVYDGATFYCVDNGDLYVFYAGTWYLQDFTEPASEAQTLSLNNRIISPSITFDEETQEESQEESER